jgi:Lrp/AsnC family transcriptional regulator, regulator for asnA, asnC and gidA
MGFGVANATPVSKPPVDDDDRRLLMALVADGRQSHRELAAATGLSLATVNRRVRRLEENGVIRGYHAHIEAEAAGWAMSALVGLRIDKGHLRDVQKTIAKDHRVFGVYDVTGEWDGVVLARLRDRADLDDLAKTTLSLAHIQRTNTMVVLATVLEDALVRVAGGPMRKPSA